ncbi:hypothetical protein QUV83_09820 [Cellulomonas cellasea]|uniref:hypothetical protein n=1 Tax=Cellulomonas cellasea TaxID=43670 RepID=UPI0025A446D4|nr:hypothetical protein [Cellulomonas cellasea]MDM8085060.1 hypothetical protein [Cellulomonas cellasea]
MSGKLSIDTVILRDAGTNLRAVATEFENANANSSQAAEHVGHAALAACIVDFAHGWDDRRAKIVENIAALSDACIGISDGFEDLDVELGRALRGEA